MAHIADDLVIVNTLGVRWVVKSDLAYDKTRFYLEVQYKGSALRVEYKDESKRDEMFERLSATLTRKAKNPAREVEVVEAAEEAVARC